MTQRNEDDDSNTYLRIQKSQMMRSNIHSISQLLNTGLNLETLDICVKLCEAGVHPQALAEVVNQIRREMRTVQIDE